jgi:hypothetical protein
VPVVGIRHNKIQKSAANRPGSDERLFDRAALARLLASACEGGNAMLKSALLIGAGMVVGAGAIQGLHAAGGPMVLTTYEANIKDEAGYTAALPEVEKYIKDNGGQRLAGGFNKAKLVDGSGAVGNRYVIVSWPNAAAFEKAQSDGLKAWIDKHGNGARQIMVEGVEAK